MMVPTGIIGCVEQRNEHPDRHDAMRSSLDQAV